MREIKVGEHWVEQIGPFVVNMDTLITTWLAMTVVIVFSFIITRKLEIIPDSVQSFSESLIGFLEGFMTREMGEEGLKHAPIVSSLFLFILFANLEGQLPWKLYHLERGELASPTNDINTTLGLALVVSIYYIIAGLCTKGLGYFKHYFQPVWIMFPFNFLEDFTRPMSLSLRLFGNILAGELIVIILIMLAPVFLPVPMMLFELFVAFIQAYIFSVLAASYIRGATAKSH